MVCNHAYRGSQPTISKSVVFERGLTPNEPTGIYRIIILNTPDKLVKPCLHIVRVCVCDSKIYFLKA